MKCSSKMKFALSMMALVVCGLVAHWALLAQDAPGTPVAADPELSGQEAGGEKPSTTTDSGITILTTFPGDTGPN